MMCGRLVAFWGENQGLLHTFTLNVSCMLVVC